MRIIIYTDLLFFLSFDGWKKWDATPGFPWDAFFSLLLFVARKTATEPTSFSFSRHAPPVSGDWLAGLAQAFPSRAGCCSCHATHPITHSGSHWPTVQNVSRKKVAGDRRLGISGRLLGPEGLSRLLIPAVPRPAPDYLTLEQSGLRINEIPPFHCETTVDFWSATTYTRQCSSYRKLCTCNHEWKPFDHEHPTYRLIPP